jgi:hypothetical protein
MKIFKSSKCYLTLTLLAIVFIFLTINELIKSHASLNFETAISFFEVINSGTWVNGKPDGFRNADMIWQLPAILYMKLSPSAAPLDVIHVLSATYFLQILFSCLLCLLILKIFKQSYNYILLPLLSSLTAGCLSLSFASGIVGGTMAVFWPLFFLLIFANSQNALIYFLFALAGLVYLAFAYETGILILFILAIVLIFKIKNKTHVLGNAILLPLTFLAMLFQIFKMFFLPDYDLGPRMVFVNDLLQKKQHGISYFGFYLTIICILTLFFSMISIRNTKLYSFFGVLIAGVFTLSLFTFHPQLMEARNYRTLAIPICFIFSIMTLIYYFKPEKLVKDVAFLSVLIFVTSVFSSFYLLKLNSEWKTTSQQILTLTNQGCGCHYHSNHFSGNSFTFISLLLQNTYKPNYMLVAKDPCYSIQNNPCLDLANNNLPYINHCSFLHIRSTKFDLKDIGKTNYEVK